MRSDYIITHYYHSGFSIGWDSCLFVFDYWRGEENELPPDRQITPKVLARYDKVYVLISHEHVDHMDPVVFTWKDYADVTYIVSSDMPVGTRGKRMAPGDELRFGERISIRAFDSTDLGVSYLLDLDGVRFFHAGDLNFWHWREESTMQEIEEADAEFRKAVQPLTKEKIDVAFFPLDPRQGSMYEAGANYFILSVKPRLMIPMHYFHRTDAAQEYARTAGNRSTEVLAMTRIGEKIGIEADEEGYLNLFFPQEEKEETPPEEEEEELNFSDDNPFADSDLPVAQLADDEPEGDTSPERTQEDGAPEAHS